MKKLVRLLRIAHAIEIGAYHAYRGHYQSLPTNDLTRLRVWLIQCEEEIHREYLERVLKRLGRKSSFAMDTTMKVIGKVIGWACFVSPRKASMFGAAVMEMLGSNIYIRLADEAYDIGLKNLAGRFLEMAQTEEKHERFFKDATNGQVP